MKISFFQRYVLITFPFSNLIKVVLNNFVYISHFTYVKFPLYLCMFWVNEHDLQSGIEIFTSKLYFFTRKLKYNHMNEFKNVYSL